MLVKNYMTAEREQEWSVEDVLEDFRICCLSREVSLLARKEVLTGKAKFGILGDGKELPQVAMARAFKKGDFRAGYYRDQTFMFALGLTTVEAFFAQLYADPYNDPFSGGRQMNAHFATPYVDAAGNWLPLKEMYNISSDISPTAGQMARAIGLALASKKYRESEALSRCTLFSERGNEVCFCTIGDASTAEGIFWEVVNAAGVMQVPLAISVWDDGYGISVPTKYQTTKGSISEALEGFRKGENTNGIDIYTAKAWDYPALCELYQKGIERVRNTHVPAVFHIQEATQPQGHSTSGSHERYKTPERLEWERDFDCLKKMREWIIENGLATDEDLHALQVAAKAQVLEARDRAWFASSQPIKNDIAAVSKIYEALEAQSAKGLTVKHLHKELKAALNPTRRDVVENVKTLLRSLASENTKGQKELLQWLERAMQENHKHFHRFLHSETPFAARLVPVESPIYEDDAPILNGFQILNTFFDKKLETTPELFAFGEDVGQIGDVNQGFAGLQQKYGEHRVFDTGIREWSIVGQGIGMAIRGLRPIAEIQYLDYLLYAIVPLSDDLATLNYRTNGIQRAPLIVRTRGHRLEGIWHTGSPMGMVLNTLRGIHLLVPRNMTQAAGMYNTLLKCDEPAVVVEALNSYRLKERLPSNLDTFTVPLGCPEILQSGTDVTIVTYGACVRIAQKGIEYLAQYNISVELIDVQTLMPFDLHGVIRQSLAKTSRIVFMDEDVPGGATGFMMQQVLEVQNGYQLLDASPVTLSAHAHRTPYGSDGDYFSKPNAEQVFETVYAMMYEAQPSRFEKMYFIGSPKKF